MRKCLLPVSKNILCKYVYSLDIAGYVHNHVVYSPYTSVSQLIKHLPPRIYYIYMYMSYAGGTFSDQRNFT